MTTTFNTLIDRVDNCSNTETLLGWIAESHDHYWTIPADLAVGLDNLDKEYYTQPLLNRILRQLFIFAGKKTGPRSSYFWNRVKPEYLEHIQYIDEDSDIIMRNILRVITSFKSTHGHRSPENKECIYNLRNLAQQVKTNTCRHLVEMDTCIEAIAELEYNFWNGPIHNVMLAEAQQQQVAVQADKKSIISIFVNWLEIEHYMKNDIPLAYVSLQEVLKNHQAWLREIIFCCSKEVQQQLLSYTTNAGSDQNLVWARYDDFPPLLKDTHRMPKIRRMKEDVYHALATYGWTRKDGRGQKEFHIPTLVKLLESGATFHGKGKKTVIKLPKGFEHLLE